MILVTEYFIPNDLERLQEFEECLHKNIQNSFIKTIVLFINEKEENPRGPEGFLNKNKIVIKEVIERPSLSDLFEFCNDNFLGNICCIANTDIYFDNSLEKLITGELKESLDNSVIALTRHDNGNIIMNSDSQDAWIFKTRVKVPYLATFRLGDPGCDNKLAYYLFQLGFKLKNPCYLIKIHHLS